MCVPRRYRLARSMSTQHEPCSGDGGSSEPHDRIPAAAATERSHSGLVQRFAKPPCGVTCIEGSNPSLSASPAISCARSSADRALGCGPKGRGFESRRARHSRSNDPRRRVTPRLTPVALPFEPRSHDADPFDSPSPSFGSSRAATVSRRAFPHTVRPGCGHSPGPSPGHCDDWSLRTAEAEPMDGPTTAIRRRMDRDPGATPPRRTG